MVKRVFKTVLLFCIVASVFVGTAFAVWTNISMRATATRSVKGMYDDIAENYSFVDGSRKFIPDRYTIYLFPSTTYMQSYLDYLDGKTSVKPEELYGHIEPIVTAGANQGEYNVSYNVNPQNSGDDGYLADIRTNHDTDYLDNGTRDNYYANVYRNDANWSGEEYGYGDPELDSDYKVSYSAYTSDEEQHNYRNLHRYDRFGYWPLAAKDDGRYLPMKIEVDETFSSNYYELVVGSPLADMGDPHDYYCYTFTLWAYVAVNKDAERGSSDKYTEPYFATGNFLGNMTTDNQKLYSGGSGKPNISLSSFCPTTVSQYFDLMGDMSVYADEEGIIRLFPKFSNGKTYNETSSDTDGSTNLPKGFLNGGGNAIRVTPTYKSDSVFNSHDFYLSYSSEFYSYNGISNVTVASLPNVSLEDFSSMTFQITGSYGNNSYADWSVWQTVFTVNQSFIDSTITTYGEGFYNIYFFFGYMGQSSGTSSNAFSGLITDICDGSRADTNGVFKQLRGKNLFSLTSGGSTTFNDGSYSKPIALAFEKVRDARIITDIKEQSHNPTQSELRTKYNSSHQYFKFISKDVYAVSAGANSVDMSKASLNSRYQYCYMLGGVDFTNTNTANFQIRFQQRYRNDINFCGTLGASATAQSGDYGPAVDLIFNPDAKGEFTKEQRFVPAFGNYFETQTFTVANDLGTDGVTANQIVFKLLSEEYKGIYDLIMVYIPREYYSVTSGGTTSIVYTKPSSGTYVTHAAGFYLYAYRQTNVFIKVLANNPQTTYTAVQEDGKMTDFIIHGGTFPNDDPNMLIFQKEYALGVTLKADDENEVPVYGSGNYSEYMTEVNESGGTYLGSRVNAYVKKWLSDGGITGYEPNVRNVVMRDHVTGAIVAYYAEAQGVSSNPNGLYYEENGKYYKLVFTDFKVKKNYVFYLTMIRNSSP